MDPRVVELPLVRRHPARTVPVGIYDAYAKSNVVKPGRQETLYSTWKLRECDGSVVVLKYKIYNKYICDSSCVDVF
jgi:hypothetical protein